MLVSVLAALLAVVVVVLIRSSLRPAKFPPGPRNLPIIGSLLWLDVSFSIYLHSEVNWCTLKSDL